MTLTQAQIKHMGENPRIAYRLYLDLTKEKDTLETYKQFRLDYGQMEQDYLPEKTIRWMYMMDGGNV